MKNRFILFILLLISFNIVAQNLKFKPYIQDVNSTSISILWETDIADDSIIEFGLTNTLGTFVNGNSIVSNGNSQIHTVTINSLERFTTYFYRVKTNAITSEIFKFKTSPFASDNESFRIIAMSDMQQDSSHPNKFNEIIHNGIIDYLSAEFGGELTDNLALVMISGDLVDNGNNFASWENTFFEPAEDLFSQIPVYPVLGNHENNSTYYFKYFKLPENGTATFEEHWWYKDYGNVRIIGLDSNNGYRIQEQLNWLNDVLNDTCADNNIDFVFAEIHHPFKSELWTPGELDYTGDVITHLEQFTTNCSKPSIHFFGHTHAYSRGSSRDHKHLWINAATAGGAIDNWGEFPNTDYDEFSVSQDNYGFVSVDVINDDGDPRIVIKRISRGDQDVIIDNEITDNITIRLNPSTVNIPTAIFPINEEIIPECVILKASNFSSPNTTAEHGQSHWQVSLNENDFSLPVAESWKNFENWYFEVDTQANDNLTDEKIIGLNENQTYYWRVRYRDKEFNWSDWSTSTEFTTGDSMASDNLLINAGAENDLANWNIVEGVVEAVTDNECDGIAPHSGLKYFAVGGLCEHSEVGRLTQDIDVSSFSGLIDNGDYYANFGGYLANFNGSDLPEMRLVFLNAAALEIETSTTLSSLISNWTLYIESVNIPVQTRTIRLELKGTRNSGTDNDSYFDDLFVSIGFDSNCSTVSVSNQTFSSHKKLKVNPNPIINKGTISLKSQDYSNLKLYIIDSNGSKVKCPIKYNDDEIIIEKGNLKSGIYFFWLRSNGNVIGNGKFIVAD